MSSSEPTLRSHQPVDTNGEPCSDASCEAGVANRPTSPAAPPLGLTDFLDVASLQEVQDSFSALTRLQTTIHDATGAPVTAPTDAANRAQSDAWLEQLITAEGEEGDRFTAPIIVEGQALGSITIQPEAIEAARSQMDHDARGRFIAAAKKLGLDDQQASDLAASAASAFAPSRASSIQFLYLLANNIARLCYQEYHARQRVRELSALHKVSTLVSAQRDLKQVLDAAARSVAEVMDVKGSVIRLIDRKQDNALVARAIYSLSDDYINKPTIRLDESDIYRTALEGKCVYVENMATDPRVLFPGNAVREGLVSMLCVGIIHQGKAVGVLQLFTGEVRRFTRFETNLVHSITHLLATAIENARLDQARLENQRMLRQLQLAADVQRRLLPAARPHMPPLDVAARYVPSYELGGDFYDFINLDGHLGIAMGDVVGKGVAASLLMASVRASLRAYAQDLYDLDEVISRVNHALCHDTLDNEFATLWYGVFDPVSLRVTFCNAGHELPLLLRDGEIYPLDTGGMIVGIDPHQRYDKALWDLKPGDAILLYTDGLVDAFNEEGERFGRKRIENALREAGDRPAKELLSHVLTRMRQFSGSRRSVDDTTLVALRVDEPGRSGSAT